jgi:hypothetical protein
MAASPFLVSAVQWIFVPQPLPTVAPSSGPPLTFFSACSALDDDMAIITTPSDNMMMTTAWQVVVLRRGHDRGEYEGSVATQGTRDTAAASCRSSWSRVSDVTDSSKERLPPTYVLWRLHVVNALKGGSWSTPNVGSVTCFPP